MTQFFFYISFLKGQASLLNVQGSFQCHGQGIQGIILLVLLILPPLPKVVWLRSGIVTSLGDNVAAPLKSSFCQGVGTSEVRWRLTLHCICVHTIWIFAICKGLKSWNLVKPIQILLHLRCDFSFQRTFPSTSVFGSITLRSWQSEVQGIPSVPTLSNPYVTDDLLRSCFRSPTLPFCSSGCKTRTRLLLPIV